MRDVVFCRMVDDINGNLDDVLNQYRLRKLAVNYTSKDISRIIVNGKQLWQYPSQDKEVINYTECVIDVVCYLCNIDRIVNKDKGGTITSNDIMEGKVDGTLTKAMLDENAEGVEVTTTLEEADESLKKWGSKKRKETK